MTRSPWAREYGRSPHEYIWGTEPSAFARQLAALLPPGARVLDLGCGEGRDSVFFAVHGFDVSGVEISAAGLRKAERLAKERGVNVLWVHGNMARLSLDGPFDLVYSCGAIHYVPRGERARLFPWLQALTRPGGYHGFIVFTDHVIHAEKGEIIDYFAPQELSRAYPGWSILRAARDEFACSRDGVPHRHSVEEFLARRQAPDALTGSAARLENETVPARTLKLEEAFDHGSNETR